MEILLATDHAGFEYKEKVKEYLLSKNYVVTDMGAYEFNSDDDYPDFIHPLALRISENPDMIRGIIFGGSGTGEAITANRHKNVRALVYYGEVAPQGAINIEGDSGTDGMEIIRLGVKHNNANVLSIGARFVSVENACKAAELFLGVKFDGVDRMQRRIEKIDSTSLL